MGEKVEEEVCVTGGTGFIGSHLIKALLEKGYRVRATVRDPANEKKVAFLWELQGAKERLKIVKANLMDEGSFDDAIAGTIGVFHTAGPVVTSEYTEKSYVEPSVKGTLNILKSCLKASTLKRVVLTSSCSAIRYDYHKEPCPSLDESNWSNQDYCRDYQLWYALGKLQAERKAWEFSKEHGLDLVVVNPSFVVGKILQPYPTSTITIVHGILKGSLKSYPNSQMGYVHIDDVVKGHVLAFEDHTISGRLICSSEVYHWRDIVEMLRKKYPMYPIATMCGSEKGNDIPHIMDTSKAKRFGIESHKIEVMFEDCISSLKDKGLL